MDDLGAKTHYFWKHPNGGIYIEKVAVTTKLAIHPNISTANKTHEVYKRKV